MVYGEVRMIFDTIQTKDGTYVPILETHVVRHDGRIGIHMTLAYKHDAIHMRDTDEVIWVKKREDSNRESPPIEIENTTEEE